MIGPSIFVLWCSQISCKAFIILCASNHNFVLLKKVSASKIKQLFWGKEHH